MNKNIFLSVFNIFKTLLLRNKVLLVIMAIITCLFFWQLIDSYRFNMGYLEVCSITKEQAYISFHGSLKTPLMFSIILTMLTTGIIFTKLSDSYIIQRIILNKHSMLGFILSYFIINMILFAPILLSFGLITLAFLGSLTGFWKEAFDILDLLKWFIYCLIALSFSIILPMWISSLKFEYNTKIIVIVIILVTALMFSNPTGSIPFGAILDNIYTGEPNWFNDNKLLAFVYGVPGFAWYLFINPLSWTVVHNVGVHSPETIKSFIEMTNPELAVLSSWVNILSWVNIILVIIYSVVLSYLTSINIRRQYG